MTVKVMCDFTADGLWINGKSINITNVIFHCIPPDIFLELSYIIKEWQDFYNLYFLYEVDYNSKEVKDFVEKGYYIANIIRKYLPDNIEVIYLDEILVNNEMDYLIKIERK